MRRIMIIGAPGSGKSTLARGIGARTGLPVYHIDRIHWLPGWVERPRAERLPLAAAIEAQEAWVFEGGLSETWPHRAARADLVIWLDLPLWLRLWRVFRRRLVWRGKTRPDLPPDCPERLDPAFLWYILRSARPNRRRMAALVAGLPPGKAVRLSSPVQVAAWLRALAPG